jgi:hypothetical protein
MSFAADVISGYQTLWEELIEAVSAPPDVVLLQAGVGAFAASAIASVGRAWPDARFFVVEPEGSACVAASMAKGRPTAVVDARTVMERLRCQEVSAAAWPLLKRGYLARLRSMTRRRRRRCRSSPDPASSGGPPAPPALPASSGQPDNGTGGPISVSTL